MLAPYHKTGRTESGIYRVGSWPIYTEFIDFMNNSEVFEQILIENGVESKLLERTIFTHGAYNTSSGSNLSGIYPKMCIWLHTDNGDYFLEDNPYLAENVLDTNYTYSFFDASGYMDKVGFMP